MKALVLSGGTGTRLRPLSHTMPKQLVPVANKPVLFHCLESIRDAGITETGIIVGDLGTHLRQAVGDGGRFGLRVTYIAQDAPLGLAHCVLTARGFLGDDDFVMYLGDNVFADGVSTCADAFRSVRPDALLLLTKVEDPAEYGIATLGESGQVTAVTEKPAHATSDLAVTGAYFFRSTIHAAIARIQPSGRGELEITDAIQWLIAAGMDVRARIYPGYWKDTGRIDHLLDCNRVFLEAIDTLVAGHVDDVTSVSGPVIVEAGAQVRGAHLRGPLIIGTGSTVVNSSIGPFTSLGRQCVVVDSTIERSIVLDGSSVRRVRGISGSVIGRRAQVGSARPGTAAFQLVIGDDCQVMVASPAL
ncbi:MAG TPA: glucose-1-phosphate thymidylyltransferase [Streptosporangiaceae bacterium]|nr:glucose-1-phosphate thymidylyltransferase [Streptosporangiaceae bacterium]